jgi:hypothetical protein
MINYQSCPPSVREQLKNYIEHRIPTGGFLTAVLGNDLKQACGRADHVNRECLFEVVEWLYNEPPAECWGTPGAVSKWLRDKAEEKAAVAANKARSLAIHNP